MRYWVVGEFHDGTTRLVGSPNGFMHTHEAEDRKKELLNGHIKLHHVTYRVASYETLQDVIDDGVLTMGYP